MADRALVRVAFGLVSNLLFLARLERCSYDELSLRQRIGILRFQQKRLGDGDRQK